MQQQSPFYLLRIPSLSIGDLEELKYNIQEAFSFDRQVLKSEENLIELSKNEDLLNGLQFSSQLFLKSLLKLQKKKPEHYKKKDRQVQRRLLEYIHRMLFNASPFSTFSYVQLLDPSFNVLRPQNDFSIHLNAKLWDLVDELIVESRDRDFQLLLRKNQFLEESPKSILYLYLDREKVQINKSRLDDIIKDILECLGKEEVLYTKLFTTLFEMGKHSSNDIHLFIRACIKAQIINPIWNPDNAFFAKKILTKVQTKQANFAFSSLDKYLKKDLDFDKTKVESYLKSSKKIELAPLFYEHAYKSEQEIDLDINPRLIQEETLGLYNLTKDLLIKNSPELISESIIEAFRNWEDPENKFDLEKLETKEVDKQIELVLPVSKGEDHDFQLGIMLKKLPGHAQCFFHNWTTGYGKYFRRYIKNYDSKTREALKDWVSHDASGLFQNNDQFNHPANDFAEEIPLLNGFGFKEAFCNSKRICIKYKDGHLLNYDTNEKVHPIDLSIQSPKSRSGFYKFINSFSKINTNFPSFLEQLRKHFLVAHPDHDFIPLIKTQHLILSKEQWMFKDWKNLLVKENDEEKRYYLINGYRSKIGIPRLCSFQFKNARKRFVDFENPISLDAFYRRIKKEDKAPLIIESMTGPLKETKSSEKFYEVYWEFSA